MVVSQCRSFHCLVFSSWVNQLKTASSVLIRRDSLPKKSQRWWLTSLAMKQDLPMVVVSRSTVGLQLRFGAKS